MDYALENLGPERFQLFCQSLIAREYPRVQCFPIAQPDGGRDAVSYGLVTGTENFIVFQVKYARNPSAEADPHKWLLAILADELLKVRELIMRGASEYVLITNVPGTAHLDAGSIDRMNDLMSKTLGLPAHCWWRNDINRRLDNAWPLKWIYPELMTGLDFLHWITETGLSEHRERRAATIRAFLRAQYDNDEEVKFKQVELQNKLLDLFIDVPMTFREQLSERRQREILYSDPALRRLAGKGVTDEPEGTSSKWSDVESTGVGQRERIFEAATLLLSGAMQTAVPRVVLEGAPGQGKSTITQYVCQVCSSSAPMRVRRRVG